MSVYSGDSLDTFEECVESIQNQTIQNFDILLYIDGRIDPRLDNYIVNNENKFRVIRSHENRGLAFAMNRLISTFNEYEYYARMDADDLMRAERIQSQLEFMDSNPNIDVVGTDYLEFSDDLAYTKHVSFPTGNSEMRSMFAFRNPVAHVTVMYRKAYFEKVGLYPENTITDEDTMMWLKGFKANCEFANINSPLVNVRVSNLFFNRRSGLAKPIADMRNRFRVVKTLKFHPKYYFLAVCKAVMQISLHPRIMHFVYKKLR